MDRDWLAGKWLVRKARHPVDGILEPAREGEVVFGRTKDNSVRGADRICEGIHGCRKAGRVLNVGVIERELRKRRCLLDGHPDRCEPRQEVHDHAIV